MSNILKLVKVFFPRLDCCLNDSSKWYNSLKYFIIHSLHNLIQNNRLIQNSYIHILIALSFINAKRIIGFEHAHFHPLKHISTIFMKIAYYRACSHVALWRIATAHASPIECIYTPRWRRQHRPIQAYGGRQLRRRRLIQLCAYISYA